MHAKEGLEFPYFIKIEFFYIKSTIIKSKI